MRRLRVALAPCISLAALLALAAACGDDDDHSNSGVDGGAGDALDDLGTSGDAFIPDEDAGTFAIEAVADTPCIARTGTERVLYPATDETGIRSLAIVGTRRVAQRFDGFVLFDEDGSNASPTAFASSTGVAVLGDAIAAVGDLGRGPFLSFHAATGATTTPPALADTQPATGVFVGGGPDTGLMVWGTQAGVRARGFQADTFISGAFFLAGVAEVQGFSASIARKGDGSFGVAFSGAPLDGQGNRRLSFVRATTTGPIPTGFNLEIGPASRRVVQLVARPDGGWAVLVDFGSPAVAHLALLTEEGRLDGPVRRLEGSADALGLAISGDELGVLAMHAPPPGNGGADAGSDGGDDASADAGDDAGDAAAPPSNANGSVRVAFRPFDTKGQALAGWVCFGDGPSTLTTAGAIVGEAIGYGAAFSHANGEIAYARFDRLGN